MRKIPTIFERDWNGDKSRVLDKRVPECEWVFEGEGVATRKFDGTAVMIQNGELWVRYDAKNGKQPPANFVGAQPDPDPETGHWPGWVPTGSDPQYKWQRKAFEFSTGQLQSTYHRLVDGTYEAVGPHFQGNPEKQPNDLLLFHGAEIVSDVPRSFSELADWFVGKDIEGIVWHHPDGRMAKIKKRDFGMKR